MRCAAVFPKRNVFQLAFEVVVANVRMSQVRWQAVPQTRSGCSKTPVVCSWNTVCNRCVLSGSSGCHVSQDFILSARA